VQRQLPDCPGRNRSRARVRRDVGAGRPSSNGLSLKSSSRDLLLKLLVKEGNAAVWIQSLGLRYGRIGPIASMPAVRKTDILYKKPVIVRAMPSLPAYAELHCISNFSFLRGASHAEELVARAVRLGYAALAITDECSFAGSVRAHLAARGTALHLIHGTELLLACGMKLALLAQNRAGYGNLSALVTLGRRRAEKGSYHLTRNDLAGWDGGGGAGLSGAVGARADYESLCLRQRRRRYPLRTALVNTATWLAEHFAGRAWIAFERHLRPDDHERLAQLRELAAATHLPLVAAGDVHMHARSRRPLQDVLVALRLNTTVAAAGAALFANGERTCARAWRWRACIRPSCWPRQ